LDKKALDTPFGTIYYTLEKKFRNKHTYLRIKEGFVDVKAGRFTSERFIRSLLLKNARTIAQKLNIEKSYFLFGKPVEKPVEIDGFYKNYAKDYLVHRTKVLSEKTALFPQKVKITKAKKRWGSCSGKNSVNLSCFLTKLPYDVIDYVIIHELCHIKHKNHSKAFWDEVALHCKDYKRRIATLREYEQKAY